MNEKVDYGKIFDSYSKNRNKKDQIDIYSERDIELLRHRMPLQFWDYHVVESVGQNMQLEIASILNKIFVTYDFTLQKVDNETRFFNDTLERLEKFDKIPNFIKPFELSSSIHAKGFRPFVNASSLGWSNMFSYNNMSSFFELREYLSDNIFEIINPHAKGHIWHMRNNEYNQKVNNSYEPEQLKRALEGIHKSLNFVPHTIVTFGGFLKPKVEGNKKPGDIDNRIILNVKDLSKKEIFEIYQRFMEASRNLYHNHSDFGVDYKITISPIFVDEMNYFSSLNPTNFDPDNSMVSYGTTSTAKFYRIQDKMDELYALSKIIQARKGLKQKSRDGIPPVLRAKLNAPLYMQETLAKIYSEVELVDIPKYSDEKVESIKNGERRQYIIEANHNIDRVIERFKLN